MYQIKRDRRYDKQIAQYDMSNGQRVVTGIDNVTRGAKRKNTAQAALQWHASDDLTFGATYTHSNIDEYVDDKPRDNDVDAGLVGIRWTPGSWYIAGDAGEYHHQHNVGFRALQLLIRLISSRFELERHRTDMTAFA